MNCIMFKRIIRGIIYKLKKDKQRILERMQCLESYRAEESLRYVQLDLINKWIDFKIEILEIFIKKGGKE